MRTETMIAIAIAIGGATWLATESYSRATYQGIGEQVCTYQEAHAPYTLFCEFDAQKSGMVLGLYTKDPSIVQEKCAELRANPRLQNWKIALYTLEDKGFVCPA